jgi:hypothetical protein
MRLITVISSRTGGVDVCVDDAGRIVLRPQLARLPFPRTVEV